MSIKAQAVKELREQTGVGMMECKKALVKAEGDMDKAIEILRTTLAVKADKRAARTAAEGVVAARVSENGCSAVILELNCETDFVGRDENFLAFADKLLQGAIEGNISDEAVLLKSLVPGSDSVSFDQERQNLSSKTGENVQLRRINCLEGQNVSYYIHGGKIGVLVALDKVLPELAKDIAMHIAATNPSAISEADMDPALIESERNIFIAQAKESGKPDNIIEKMVEGRVSKFLKESCLISQPFVKDSDSTVGDLLKAQDATVSAFIRFELGEGIEKKEVDFASEVQAQIEAS